MSTSTANRYLEELERNHKHLQRLGVRRIGLFGSCVRGDERADSDIDLLVEFVPERKTLGNLVELGDFLERIFERHVELVTPEALSPYIGPAILREVQYARLAA